MTVITFLLITVIIFFRTKFLVLLKVKYIYIKKFSGSLSNSGDKISTINCTIDSKFPFSLIQSILNVLWGL